jgi:hypothetical protein
VVAGDGPIPPVVVDRITFPFRSFQQIREFLTDEPEEHDLVDVLSTTISDKDIRQSLWDHIEDLRKHLLRSLLALSLAVGISFIFTQPLIRYLAEPVGGLDTLRAIEVTESIGVFMKVALLSGLALSLPYIAFEFWLFAAPGLKPRSRSFGLVAIPVATLSVPLRHGFRVLHHDARCPAIPARFHGHPG